MRKSNIWAALAVIIASYGTAWPLRAAPSSTVAEKWQIVAGKSIGRVKLGDSRATVRRRRGKPARTFVLSGGLTSDLWRSVGRTHDDTTEEDDVLEVVYQRNLATQIEARGPSFRAQYGLSSRNYAPDWTRVFGPSRQSGYTYGTGDEQRSQMYYDWTKRGLAIETIGCLVDGEGDSATLTIIVHRVGARVVVDEGGKPAF